MFYLSRYPACYEKLAAEIRSTFLDSSDIHSGPVMMSYPYLRACINETMRMSPPAGGAMWREVEPPGACIDGYLVPEGYDVGTSMYAIHHNEVYYPDSYTFTPERWLQDETNSEAAVERAYSALNPFSLGPGGCVERSLACMELSGTLAMLIWHLDFRRPQGQRGRLGEGTEGLRNGRHRVNEFQLVDHLTSLKDGPFVEFCWRRS
ncbi:hypothetical protein MMC30_009138 [Trapelia coarctata]|nr:hypothetical protein [Trapelia coarctata]